MISLTIKSKSNFVELYQHNLPWSKTYYGYVTGQVDKAYTLPENYFMEELCQKKVVMFFLDFHRKNIASVVKSSFYVSKETF